MEDQNMAGYNTPGALEMAAQEPANSHQDHPNRPHTHHNPHSRKNRHRDSGAVMSKLANALGRTTLEDDNSKHKKCAQNHNNHINHPETTHRQAHGRDNSKKNKRKAGVTTMKQLANMLARSNLRDDDDHSKYENGKKLTPRQRKRQKSREAQAQRADSATATKSGGQSGKRTTRETRSMTGMLPLPFNGVCLSKVHGFREVMNNQQIRDWLKSVFKPHIEDWYHDCLSIPEFQPSVEAAQAAPFVFCKMVTDEAMNQHDSSGLLGSLLGETDACPTAFHLEKKRNNSLTFIQHSAMVACLIVRDGHISQSFSGKALERKRHQAAAALLASVIMDFKTDFGYFLRLLLDLEGKDRWTIEDERTLLAMQESEDKERGAAGQVSVKEVPRLLRMSSALFGSIARALAGLQYNSDCEISFRKSTLFPEEYHVVLAGASGQVREAEHTIRTLAESSPVPADAAGSYFYPV
jgi:hypothetical protein